MGSVFDSPQFNDNLFFPQRDYGEPPAGVDEMYIEVERDLRVHARRYPNQRREFSLLYFHGNGEVVSDHDRLAADFSALGSSTAPRF